ncbi:MAG: hypothetical protein JWQ07_3540 [Ramlibacter sp.]|nr:hypothetical protein [Ramlibacter sp.]
MDKIIVYLDDADYARQQLAPMKGSVPAGGKAQATHWVLVACPPRMTRRISKWVSHSAREKWRAKWSDKLFGQVVPALLAGGDKVTTLLASGSLVELTARLAAEHGASRVLDARRPRFGEDLQPVTADQPAPTGGRWEVPGAVVGMGALLVLAAE